MDRVKGLSKKAFYAEHIHFYTMHSVLQVL